MKSSATFLLIIICFSSCSDNNAINISKKNTEYFFKYYNEKKFDSVIMLLGDDFLSKTDSTSSIKILNDLYNTNGKILSTICYRTKQINKFEDNKKIKEIIITYMVIYKSNDSFKEIFHYVYNDSYMSGKIFSMHFEPWKGDE